MGLREKLLEKLENNRGEYFSGEELAQECGVSRGAVWKAVKGLRKEGFSIEAATNRGYALSPCSDLLTAGGIEKYLTFPCKIQVKKSVASTNDEVKDIASKGGAEWNVVVAEEQTAGRGRYNRPFVSAAGNGVYFSVLLRPKFSASETLFITTCAAVAVCEAVESVTGHKADIKWVNDVYMKGKKVCGILTEASFDVESGGLSYAVVGIGVNVLPQKFPSELEKTAASVFGQGEYPQEGRAKILSAILNRFRFYYEHIPERTFFREYKRRSIAIGRRVKVVSGSFECEGTVLDLDENCFLKIRFDDGTEKLLSSGEISIKL